MKEYRDHIAATIKTGAEKTRSNAGRNLRQSQPFRDVNKFRREMTLFAADYADLWSNFHEARSGLPTREIYSDPFGSTDDSGDIYARLRPAPTGLITGMTVWGTERIQSVEVRYAAKGGPGGADSSGRMGETTKGSELPPRGGRVPVRANNPIVAARARNSDVVDAFEVTFKDGKSREFGGGSIAGDKIAFDDHLLSSIHVNGVSKFYRCADCIVFGFEYDRNAPVSPEVLQILHVASPKRLPIAALAEQTGNDRKEIEEIAAASRWDATRRSHWSAIRRGQL
jgi:hypothetical protein